MCRLLGYLGQPTLLHNLIEKPTHSLVVQSYKPQEMTGGLLNADGFGIGWYDLSRQATPFTYKNILPIWSDINLPHLSHYIESSCILANVRSATPGQAVDLSNCQPFSSDRLLGIHNGYIENFRASLYRPMRKELDDDRYQAIGGTTDSEHIFALLCHNLQRSNDLIAGLQTTLLQVLDWARVFGVKVSLNLILSDGKQLVACRCASLSPAPSLYWLQGCVEFPRAIVVASERLFPDEAWIAFPENSILAVSQDLQVKWHGLT
ncbi:ergothioneine biosynthesis protein EgtC [Pseudanabaena sp. PCC 6802]|uniref:ergothioneine biosynthesis protein EgtC n=1 Tax=Pseudanabaena sp. PCC 6802 TaxID=118173 RepID=UPI00036FFB21|nr:ergothioneine biosynthesis protein EgtC [Pseudanabaena sp. PCC 6802]